ILQKMQQERKEPGKDAELAFKKMTDSLAKAPLKGFSRITDSIRTLFDSDNNPVFQENNSRGQKAWFRYRFSKDGQPAAMTKVIEHKSPSIVVYRLEEQHAAYDSAGRISVLRGFQSNNDTTVDISSLQYLAREQRNYYDKEGAMDSVVYKDTYVKVKHDFSYEDGRQSAMTILKAKSPDWIYDTMSHTEYKFWDGRLTGMKLDFYFRKKLTGYNRWEYWYNDAGYPVEALMYIGDMDRDIAYRETPLEQHLFFYGGADDRQTALRRRPAEQQRRTVPTQTEQAPAEEPVYHPSDPLQKKATGSGPEIFTFVEEMPEFPGDLLQYIRTHFRYPEAVKDTVEGKVFMRFIVQADGSITNVEVVRKLEPHLDEEAIRLVKSMPRWRPG
ncbi:MAG: hypothetical protein EOP49_46395, partial [Sphingobacteriales bacterium]